MEAPEKPKSDATAVIHAWWQELIKPTEPGQPSRRGELAGLRRCATLSEVLFDPAYQRLFHRVADQGWNDRLRIAAVAGLLAHVKKPVDDTDRVAKQLAKPTENGGTPRVSERRFKHLVTIKDVDDLFPALRRIIHLAGDAVPVPDLIESIRFWGDKRRASWTFDYYDTLIANEHKS